VVPDIDDNELNRSPKLVGSKSRSTFHSFRNSGTFKMGGMVMLWKFPWEVYRKSETIKVKIVEISGIPGEKSNKTEIPGKTFLKIWMYLARLTPFPNILESIQGSHPLVVVVFDYQ